MKKSGFIILVIIGIIALGVVLGIMGKPEDAGNLQATNTNKNNAANNSNSNAENNASNKKSQNTVNTENKAENENNVNEETGATETFKEEPKTESEKAIELVKLDYGNADNVSIKVEGINNDGTYIISVRDKNTTQALAFYTVNVSEKTFTKREMN